MPSAGKVLDSGTVTSLTVNTLTDTSKAWAVNFYTNSLVYFPRSGEVLVILSNTANTLTLSGSFFTSVGESYSIREDAANPQTIPTTATLAVYSASGAAVSVPVVLA